MQTINSATAKGAVGAAATPHCLDWRGGQGAVRQPAPFARATATPEVLVVVPYYDTDTAVQELIFSVDVC